MKQYFLFDLDGTIADNGEGILKSAQYSLDAFGIHNQPEAKLRQFVGPPLMSPFRELYGFSQSRRLEAVKKYRERYHVKGVYENKLYPGVAHLVKTLSQRGSVCLATLQAGGVCPGKSWRCRGSCRILQVVVGAELDGTRTNKAEVIQAVLEQLGAPPKSQAVMIGDRKHDILGAKAVGAGEHRRGVRVCPGRGAASRRCGLDRSHGGGVGEAFASPCVDPRRQGRPPAANNRVNGKKGTANGRKEMHQDPGGGRSAE